MGILSECLDYEKRARKIELMKQEIKAQAILESNLCNEVVKDPVWQNTPLQTYNRELRVMLLTNNFQMKYGMSDFQVLIKHTYLNFLSNFTKLV